MHLLFDYSISRIIVEGKYEFSICFLCVRINVKIANHFSIVISFLISTDNRRL